ncbi:hypothetical protein QCA50_000559 [Cerrena zonata]|uniref:Protein-S-isoprenylcysteine O-methyltransferase n=1 Tax=Cerrena zonata TaxID=2478898 RepID=A0AAW0GZW3_9APHY
MATPSTPSSSTPPNSNGNGTPIQVDRSSIRAEVTGPDLPSLPAKTGPLEMKPVSGGVVHSSRIPNSPLSVAAVSFILGTVFSFGLVLCFFGGSWGFWWSQYQLGIYISSWAAFHWGEFAVTAGWNREKVSVDSFLLENGSMYHLAHTSALLEYLITLYFKPSLKSFPYVSAVGLIILILGQIIRSTAMIHAATSFSHQVAFKKLESHTLVTSGIYAWFRHPSYAGFFYWALGTQLLLQNTANFVFFSIVLWRFFYHRIRPEEGALINFFGQSYVDYRKRVGTKIPFIP